MREFRAGGDLVYISPNWSISDKINARTTLSATIVSLLSCPSVSIGDTVTLVDGLDTLFSGIISTLDVDEPHPNYLNYNIQCVDNSALADKILIAETGTNETAGYIVENVILPYLVGEGVVLGAIEAGIVISKYTFNYIKCSTALDQLRTISGLNWNIDKDKRLNLFSNNSSVAPFTLDNSVQHSRFKQSASLNQYRNVQYIRAGKGKTLTQPDEQPSPKPDGISKTFTLKYPLAERPSSLKINDVAIDVADIGINLRIA